MRGHIFTDASDEGFVRVHIHQLQVPEEARRAGEMDVVVVEARRDERALQVNQPRAFALQRQDLFVAADLDDLVAAHSDGFSLRLRFVNRPDEAVVENQIGGSALDSRDRGCRRTPEAE